MKNIIKILSFILMIPLLLTSCTEETYRDWKSAEPSFKLHNTTLGTNVLYPTMDSNPFRLTWDNNLAGATYNVVLSTTEDFKTKIALGTSTTNTFTTTIGALNTALLGAGYSPYSTKKVYVRIESGDKISNMLNFDVQPYPSTVPVITSPTTTSDLLLLSATPEAAVTTVTWNDYSYGVDVDYLVEIAKSGSTNFVNAGTVKNLRILEWTHKALNEVVLKAGLVPNVKAAVDVKVTAITKSTGGELKKQSNIVTFKVTPYVAFKNYYLVGDATAAGWNPDNNNQALFRDPSNANKFYFTGKFGTSMFKFLEIIGQWQPQWGLKAGAVANSDGGDPDPFMVSTAGYYSFTVDVLAKTYSLTPYTGAMNSYATMGLIGSATPNGWGGDTLMTQSAFDSHQWSLKGVQLSAGEVKFRANSDWGTNWGSSTEFSGQGTSGGPNIPVGEAGTYNVYFNDIDGRYLLVKL